MSIEQKHDDHSGWPLTGHEWNGIIELNRPAPKAFYFFLTLAVLFSIACWILLPAFPLGKTFTPGLLGMDQRTTLEAEMAKADAARAVWRDQVATMSFADIPRDAALMAPVREAGRTLFNDNCAACHGVSAAGGPGYPSLVDREWLWGGEPEAVFETIRVGINSTHPETRISQMTPFGASGALPRESVVNVVEYVRSLSHLGAPSQIDAKAAAAGADVFATTCAACHGADARGGVAVGAPDLTDHSWIYGGAQADIFHTVEYGRQGHMPTWEARLSETDRKILTLYVLDLAALYGGDDGDVR